ncbi:hypothetical protein TNCV_4313521 [Trichonephila clavipes]|nr:hypothetical protein TNCV_4313521 [Trichonephila clavipes]
MRFREFREQQLYSRDFTDIRGKSETLASTPRSHRPPDDAPVNYVSYLIYSSVPQTPFRGPVPVRGSTGAGINWCNIKLLPFYLRGHIPFKKLKMVKNSELFKAL